MPLMDEFKKEREDMKNQPFKKRLEYFWDYYKWWVIGGAFVLIALIVSIVNTATRKNAVLYVAMVNTVSHPMGDAESAITRPFLEAEGYTSKKDTINFNTDFIFSAPDEADDGSSPSYADTMGFSSRENLAVYVSAGDVDILCGSSDWYDIYSYNNFFADLSQVLSAEDLALYSDRLYYMDMALMADIVEKTEADITYQYKDPYPDGTKPEEMREPVPVGIILDDCEMYNNNFIPADSAPHSVIGLIVNGKNGELSEDLIRYIIKGGM